MRISLCRPSAPALLSTLLTLLFLAEGALGADPPPAQIAVSPPRIEMELGTRPVREHLRLANLGDKPVEVSVSTVNWDLDENNRVRVLPPNEQSLDQWMITNPTRFTIPAGESQVVRFAIRPRVRPEPGEHRAMIYFTEVPSGSATEGRVRVVFRVGAAIYAHVGDVTRRGKLRDVSRDGDSVPARFLFDIESEGKAHIRLDGQYAVWPASAYPGRPGTRALEDLGRPEFEPPKPIVIAGRLPTTPVLPGARRRIPLSLGASLSPGRYVLDVSGVLGETEIRREVPFTVSAAP